MADDKADSESGGTLVGTGLEDAEDPLVEAAMAVQEHRAALRAGDIEAVDRTLDLHAWGAGPRGILSKLAGTEGVERAVEKLVPFFQKARFEPETARVVDRDLVEVYERMTHPALDKPMRTLSLVRRRGGYWRVVTTADTPDEKLHICLFCDTEGDAPIELDPKGFSAAATQTGLDVRLVERDGELVLAEEELEERARVVVCDPFEAGLHVTGPELEELLIGNSTLASISLVPSTDLTERLWELAWLTRSVAFLAEHHKGTAAYLPTCDRIIEAKELGQLKLSDPPTMRELGVLWVHFRVDDGWLGTRGMSHFMLPEIEVSLEDIPDQAKAAKVVAETAGGLLSKTKPVELGDRIHRGGEMLLAILGRRGPSEGITYGRWGSLRLIPAP